MQHTFSKIVLSHPENMTYEFRRIYEIFKFKTWSWKWLPATGDYSGYNYIQAGPHNKQGSREVLFYAAAPKGNLSDRNEDNRIAELRESPASEVKLNTNEQYKSAFGEQQGIGLFHEPVTQVSNVVHSENENI